MTSKQTDVIVVGAGGFSRETAEAIRAGTAAGARSIVMGFVDDDPALCGTAVDGLPVLGTIEWAGQQPDIQLVIGTGRPDEYTSRLRIVERLGLPGQRYAPIVHPAASLASTTTVGRGTVVLAGAIATASVAIGDHVAIMPSVVLTHDDIVDDY